MIDLFALACVLSRASSSLKRDGAQGATREIEIARILAGQVKHRVRHNLAAIDNNDDELLKSLASHALEAERFSWDTL